jgi:DNA-binding transcriptional regulator YdaS (Cro superfamily)
MNAARSKSAPTVRRLLDQAIAIYGSQAKLAKACGISQQSLAAARLANRVSAQLAMKIEVAVSGQILARDLRPDLPWPSATSELVSG